MGKTPSRKNPEYWRDGTHDWVTIADLGSFDKFVGKTKERINDLGVKESSIKLAPANTVLMSFKLSLGKTAVTVDPVYTNEAIMAFVDKGTHPVDVNFMYHQCKSKDWTRGTNTAVMGKTLNKKTLGNALVWLPSINDQHHIAAELDFIDGQIKLANQQIAQLDQLVKSRFVEMFVGGTHPTVKLADLTVSMRNGLSPSKGGRHHARVLTLSSITQGTFDATAWKEGVFAMEPPADKRVSNDDFYVCRGNGNKQLVGAGDYSPVAMNDLVFPDTVIAVKINQDQVIMPFLKYAWARPSVRKQIESSAKTTNGTFKINQTALSNIEVPLPPLALQQEFAAFTAQVDKTRAIAQRQIDKLQTLYDSLAQNYFA